MIVAGVGSAAYLVATGQAGSVDGLFLVLTALLIAACFAMYVAYAIGRAMEPAKPVPAAKPAVKAAAKPDPVAAQN